MIQPSSGPTCCGTARGVLNTIPSEALCATVDPRRHIHGVSFLSRSSLLRTLTAADETHPLPVFVRGDERTVLRFFAKYERKVVSTGHVVRNRLDV